MVYPNRCVAANSARLEAEEVDVDQSLTALHNTLFQFPIIPIIDSCLILRLVMKVPLLSSIFLPLLFPIAVFHRFFPLLHPRT